MLPPSADGRESATTAPRVDARGHEAERAGLTAAAKPTNGSFRLRVADGKHGFEDTPSQPPARATQLKRCRRFRTSNDPSTHRQSRWGHAAPVGYRGAPTERRCLSASSRSGLLGKRSMKFL